MKLKERERKKKKSIRMKMRCSRSWRRKNKVVGKLRRRKISNRKRRKARRIRRGRGGEGEKYQHHPTVEKKKVRR